MVLLLALLPPLLNVNRLQRRIAAGMSASLGRTVHLDNVSLHVLPVPGFTLENLVVSEDPAFGSEPVIRANTVEVTLRPSSLWRRQVEFSTIKFVEPSLNLVRNAQGTWNVQSLLMHAARVDTAPTEQRKAGPQPRFPYIEATGARVNFKIGEEKKPFSLTEADFALWLPTSQQWHVRLVGKPARTDTNISDPGTVKLEGWLERAATMAEVPVDLTGSWEGAPLGEASKLLSGVDEDWRGNLTVRARLTGELGTAKLTTTIHMEELRRADFVPVQTMDVRAECSGTVDVTTAVVRDPDCSVNAPLPEGAKVAGRVVALADSVDLSELSASGLHVGMTNIPNAWLLDWARLFTQRIPAGERPGGSVAGSVAYVASRPGVKASWQGEIHGEIVSMAARKAGEGAAVDHAISIASETAGEGGETTFVLAPLSLTQGKAPGLVLSGEATLAAYSLRLTGTATEEQVLALRSMAPPLGDGVEKALGDGGSGKAMKIDVTCSRAWGAGQTCVAGTESAKKPSRRRR
jgi:AsmA protein